MQSFILTDYVGFPGLGISMTVNPVAFTLFGKNIYWYGIIIAIGILVAVLVCTRLAARQGLNPDQVLDVVLWGTPCGIVCARLYYCAFTWEQYVQNPLKIFAVWEGGIAIYGAVIGAVAAAYIYCRLQKISWRKMFDVCTVGLLIGQCIGRWGNFVNREAYGSATNLPWRMELRPYNGAPLFVHPTFLYESLWNFFGIFLLLFINKHKTKDGEACFTYFIWYGIGRFFIEGLRVDSLWWGPFRFSQVFAALTVILGIVSLYILKRGSKKLK